MRKAQREVRDLTEIVQILDRCDICRLGLADGDRPYIVPMNFGYHLFDNQLTLYFHCALAGRKLEIINQNSLACFEMDCSHQLQTGQLACEYSMNYESIIGSGTIEIINDSAERLFGLNCLMHHYSGRADWSFEERALSLTNVLRLQADEFVAKRLVK